MNSNYNQNSIFRKTAQTSWENYKKNEAIAPESLESLFWKKLDVQFPVTRG